MSDENNNNNNEALISKKNINPDDIDKENPNKKSLFKLNTIDSSIKNDLLSNFLSPENMPSSKTLFDDVKTLAAQDNETVTTEGTNLLKRSGRKKSIRKKRKKIVKKGKKSEVEQIEPETESILLTEVKPVPKKIEESLSHKYLKKKLEDLSCDKNLQYGINSGFDKVKEEIKDNLGYNYNFNENKKFNFEELLSKSKSNVKLNFNKNGIIYNIDKESIMRLKNLKNNEKYIRNKLSKIEVNRKIIDSELPIKNDIIMQNTRKNNLKRIESMKNNLLLKLRYNSSKISEIIESNKLLNRNLLIKNYMSPIVQKSSRIINSDNNNSNMLTLDNATKNIHYCLSEDQENFNRHLLEIQKEQNYYRDKALKDLEISNKKKIKELELNENMKIQKQKNHLEELRNKEKIFLTKIKEKNDLILKNSNKFIDKKNHKKTKDYLFSQLKEKFDKNEKKLIDKANMVKKDSLVTKKELRELADKREEQKKILEEGINDRKIKLLKMWKQRSQTLPVYKHPVVDMLEDEEYDLLENEEDKKEKKEKNEREKKNYKPPPVKVDFKLKQIREGRYMRTKKDSVIKTEINNKNRLMKNLNFIANIIEAAKEEELEKENNKQKTKKNNNFDNFGNKIKKNRIAKSKESKKHNYILHPKPEKPIDYLKEIIKKNDNMKSKIKKDVGVGDIFTDLRDVSGKNNINHISEMLDMIKSKTNAIDQKVLEKKEFLKAKGGYLNNTKLGDEVGTLLIKSIQTKLSLLNKFN